MGARAGRQGLEGKLCLASWGPWQPHRRRSWQHSGAESLRGWVCKAGLLLKTGDLLRSRIEVPLAFTPALLYIVPISPDFTSAVAV